MKTFTLIVLLVVASIGANAQTFTPKAPYPTNGKSRAAAFSIGNNGYYGSGDDLGGSPETNSFYKYDQTLNSWSSIASMPSGMQADVGFTIGNYGYVGVGWCCSYTQPYFY